MTLERLAPLHSRDVVANALECLRHIDRFARIEIPAAHRTSNASAIEDWFTNGRLPDGFALEHSEWLTRQTSRARAIGDSLQHVRHLLWMLHTFEAASRPEADVVRAFLAEQWRIRTIPKHELAEIERFLRSYERRRLWAVRYG